MRRLIILNILLIFLVYMIRDTTEWSCRKVKFRLQPTHAKPGSSLSTLYNEAILEKCTGWKLLHYEFLFPTYHFHMGLKWNIYSWVNTLKLSYKALFPPLVKFKQYFPPFSPITLSNVCIIFFSYYFSGITEHDTALRAVLFSEIIKRANERWNIVSR